MASIPWNNAIIRGFMVKEVSLRRQISDAIAACEDKKAEEVRGLEMDRKSGAFTDYFLICSGTNPRQVQAISDAVAERLGKGGLRPTHIEGYKQAEWVLLDYVDFVVHVFSEKARKFYNRERLWKSAAAMTGEERRASLVKQRAAGGARVRRRKP